MQTAYAWQWLHDPEVSGRMDSEEYYDLCLKAGLSEKAAARAARERALHRLRKDLPV